MAISPHPWIQKDNIIRGADGYSVCQLHGTLDDDGTRVEDNGRLIRNAPRMLKAIDTILREEAICFLVVPSPLLLALRLLYEDATGQMFELGVELP